MIFFFALLAAQSLVISELKVETLRAFDRHIQTREALIEQRLRRGPFLWTDESLDRTRRVRQGHVVVESRSGRGGHQVPGGLIHDWIGAVFVPGVTLKQVLQFVQNYDNHSKVYGPEVIGSKLRSRNDNEFRVYLRLLKKKVLTVVLDTEHEVRYFPVDATHHHSRSYSTRIAEVKDPGEPGEVQLPPGRDHGFLWRLYSYWRFQERDGGVWVECEAISLTRGIPLGLGWLISPIIRELPQESLEGTLSSTRAALARGG